MLNIFDIQHFCIQDGLGIRTTVFLKGCPLRCKWCHNPESQIDDPQILFYEHKCTGCKLCGNVCKQKAHQFLPDRHLLDYDKCTSCGECVNACATMALSIAGRQMSCKEVYEEIFKDLLIYRRTGGGVTFSGGEPLMQADELRELLFKCQNAGIHTAIETCLHIEYKEIENIMPFVNLFICDIKAINKDIHKQGTGMDNSVILENFTKLAARFGGSLWVRIPVIPGFNDSEDEFEKIGIFIADKKIERVELLPFHDVGNSKYTALAMPNSFEKCPIPSKEKMQDLKEMLMKKGVNNLI